MVGSISQFAPSAIALIASAIAVRLWIKDRSRSARMNRPERDVARRSVPVEGDAAATESPRPIRRDLPARTVPGGPILIAVPDMTSPGTPPDAVPEGLSHRFGPIWELADSGASPEAIARATGQPVGQVELILGLRRVGPRRA